MEQYIHSLNLLFTLNCQKHTSRKVLGFAFDQKMTYGELYEKVAKVANYLKSNGIASGDRIALLGENSPQWCIAYFASINIGASVVPILPDFCNSRNSRSLRRPSV